MAYTFIQVVNLTLQRRGDIQTDLTTFTDTARHRTLQQVLQFWNDIIRELYALGAVQGETATGTLTLVTGTREYATPTDFIHMAGTNHKTRVMTNTDSYRMYEYPGGYIQMFADQTDPSDETGRPNYWSLNTTNNTFRVDVTPTSDENGDIYSFLYDQRHSLSNTTDTFPFHDTAVDALIPVVSQMMTAMDANQAPNDVLSGESFATAIASLVKKSDRWGRY